MTPEKCLEALRCHLNPWNRMYLAQPNIAFRAEFRISSDQQNLKPELYESFGNILESFYFSLSRHYMRQVPDHIAHKAKILITYFPYQPQIQYYPHITQERITDPTARLSGLIGFSGLHASQENLKHVEAMIIAATEDSAQIKKPDDYKIIGTKLKQITSSMPSPSDLILKSLRDMEVDELDIVTLF